MMQGCAVAVCRRRVVKSGGGFLPIIEYYDGIRCLFPPRLIALDIVAKKQSRRGRRSWQCGRGLTKAL